MYEMLHTHIIEEIVFLFYLHTLIPGSKIKLARLYNKTKQ